MSTGVEDNIPGMACGFCPAWMFCVFFHVKWSSGPVLWNLEMDGLFRKQYREQIQVGEKALSMYRDFTWDVMVAAARV